MILRLSFLLLLTACAGDYPSPYSAGLKRADGEGGRGLWAPPLVKVTAQDLTVTGYYASLRPFPADKKPSIERPEGLLDEKGVADRSNALAAARDAANRR